MSPSITLMSRWSLLAMRTKAEVGSPWLPVVISTTSWGGNLRSSLRFWRIPGGIFRYPISVATATLSSMLRPTIPTLRWARSAASTTCCTLEIREANVATITRPGASAMARSKASPTTRSDWV